MVSLSKIIGLARLIIMDGYRRKAIVALILFAVFAQAGGIFFSSFIPRDIGRAANDFMFSLLWLVGFIFILSHCVYVAAWDDSKRTIHTYLARPLSRREYVWGLFVGFSFLLFVLNLSLSSFGLAFLLYIKSNLAETYFQSFSLPLYLLSSVGLFLIELTILSVVLLFSCVVRGTIPVLLLTLSYYFICSGLPVVRSSFATITDKDPVFLLSALKWVTAIFPDFSRLDYKSLVTTPVATLSSIDVITSILLSLIYVLIVLILASYFYEKRDLQ